MHKLDVLIDLFYTDDPWGKRVAGIADCGFQAVETWGGGDPVMLKTIHDAGRDHDVELVSIVMNGVTDDEVSPNRPENMERFIDRIDRYSDNALAAGCCRGIVTAGQIAAGSGYQAQRQALIQALRAAGEKAAAKGFALNLEPLNTEVDHPGYLLDCPRDAVAIVREVGLPNVKILYDLYHMTIMSGNQTAFLQHNIDAVGHFHAAGVPGRHEPFYGETDYPFVLEHIEGAGYDGYIGLEYKPRLKCPDSLVKTLEYMNRGR